MTEPIQRAVEPSRNNLLLVSSNEEGTVVFALGVEVELGWTLGEALVIFQLSIGDLLSVC